MVTIRQATPRDEDAIGSISLEAWRIGYRRLVPDDGIARLDPEHCTTPESAGNERRRNRQKRIYSVPETAISPTKQTVHP
jgi:hypothetical protein